MNVVEVQYVHDLAGMPSTDQFQIWVDQALSDYEQDTEIVIRIVDEKESAVLNAQFRHKQGPTNILSFPFEVPDSIELNLLGDVVICAPVVAKEATQQNKHLIDHWAHIVVHGILHLLGYDHQQNRQAEQMEAKEITILGKLFINNPYREVKDA